MAGTVDLSEFDWLPAHINFRSINCLAFAANICDWVTPENWISQDMIFTLTDEEDYEGKTRIYKEALSYMFMKLGGIARIIYSPAEVKSDEDLAVLRFDLDDDLRLAEFHAVRQYRGRWVETCGASSEVNDIINIFSIEDTQWEWDTNSLNDCNQSDNIYIAVNRYKADPMFDISYPLEGYAYSVVDDTKWEMSDGSIYLVNPEDLGWFYSLEEVKEKSKDISCQIYLKSHLGKGKMKDRKGISTSEVYTEHIPYIRCSKDKDNVYRATLHNILPKECDHIQKNFTYLHASLPTDSYTVKMIDYLQMKGLDCLTSDALYTSYCLAKYNKMPEEVSSISQAFGLEDDISDSIVLDNDYDCMEQVDRCLFDSLYRYHMDIETYCKSTKHRQFLVYC